MHRFVRFAVIVATAATLLALAAVAPRGAAGQVMGAVRPHQDRVADYLLRAAEQMPAEDYDFRPVPEVRSFGEIVGHVADAQYYFCSTALGESNPVEESMEEHYGNIVTYMRLQGMVPPSSQPNNE